MCGIIGCNNRSIHQVSCALDTMSHRGPDNGGVATVNSWIFGHRRLSIIDLQSISNQPFSDDRYTLVFNGEIYNYRVLRVELERRGVIFTTDSDTEVLFRLLILEGIDAVCKLRGMFAFAFYDCVEDIVFLARDSFGIKPLYYCNEGGNFSFASTVKALKNLGIRSLVDESAIAEFLVCGFVNEPRTGLKNIDKLPPQSIGVFKKGELQIRSYTTVEVRFDSLREALKSSISEQLNSDVPAGLFFSGGVDSSLMLSFIKESEDIEVVTVRDDSVAEKTAGQSSDYNAAKRVALRNNLKLAYLDVQDRESSFLDDLKFVVNNVEELVADHTFLSSYEISKLFRDRGRIVALSGMGADELFFGYNRFRAIKYRWVLKVLIPFLPLFDKYPYWSKKTDRLKFFISEKNPFFAYYSLVSPFNIDTVKALLRYPSRISEIDFKDFDKKRKLSNDDLLNIERMGFLAHNLTVADKSSMLASIELRVPLLSEILLNYVRLQKFKGFIVAGITKFPLKRLAYSFMGFTAVFRKKRGFNPTLDAPIKELGYNKVMQELSNTPIFKYIKKEGVNQLLIEHYIDNKNHTYKLYNLLFLAYWLKMNEE